MLINENGVFEILERRKTSGVNTVKSTRLIKRKDTIISNVIENKFNIEIDDDLFIID